MVLWWHGATGADAGRDEEPVAEEPHVLSGHQFGLLAALIPGQSLSSPRYITGREIPNCRSKGIADIVANLV